MEPEVIDFQGKTLLCMRRRFVASSQDPASLWGKFRRSLAEMGAHQSGPFFNITCYDPGFEMRNFGPNTAFDRLAAVEVSTGSVAVPHMEIFQIPPGKYARFIHEGPAATFPESLRHFYGAWLPHSGYQLADRPHFEILGPEYRPDDPQAREEVWIPVQ